MTISQKILSIMEEKHITQKKLSEFAGISTSAISDWEKKGQIHPLIKSVLLQIA